MTSIGPGEPVYTATGKVIGRWRWDADYQALWADKGPQNPERHRLRKFDAWATDATVVDALPAAGGVRFTVPDGTLYRAPKALLDTKGWRMDLGDGMQVLLREAQWEKQPPLPTAAPAPVQRQRPAPRAWQGPPLELRMVPLGAIIPWTYNPADRVRETQAMQHLVQSLAEDGQYDPVKLFPVDGGKFVLLDGHRREWAARWFLGWPELRALVFPRLTEAHALRAVGILNLVRTQYGAQSFLEIVRQGGMSLADVLSQAPPQHHKMLNDWIQNVPDAETQQALLQALGTPYAMDVARRIVRYLEWPPNKLGMVLAWMAKQGRCTGRLDAFLKVGASGLRPALQAMILNDQPFDSGLAA